MKMTLAVDPSAVPNDIMLATESARPQMSKARRLVRVIALAGAAVIAVPLIAAAAFWFSRPSPAAVCGVPNGVDYVGSSVLSQSVVPAWQGGPQWGCKTVYVDGTTSMQVTG